MSDRARAARRWTPASGAAERLARAYVVSGKIAEAKAAYKDFLTLGKDSDSDIPIYKAAKAEYAKLQ